MSPWGTEHPQAKSKPDQRSFPWAVLLNNRTNIKKENTKNPKMMKCRIKVIFIKSLMTDLQVLPVSGGGEKEQ